jgi:hypothetical protein
MRLMLLAQAMEAARTGDGGELSADIVRVVHIAPAANRNFALSLTSPALARYGKTVSSIWSRIAPAERFLSIATESLLTVIEQVAPEPLHPWRDYLLQRYGWWR